MFRFTTLIVLTLLAVSYAQQVGREQAENHPTITVQQCSSGGSCTTQQRSVVLDSNWRWTHIVGGYTNCYTGNEWNTTACSNGKTCAQNCAIEGADYSGTYGITTSGSELSLKFVTTHQYGKNIGSRVYLLESESKYQMFNLLNQEFTFDVDMSQLPCGLNGAVYFVSMDADGGMAKYSGNKAGAKYGTGYCDTQCPHDIKFINGEANVEGWKPSPNDTNAGSGKYGTCCNEMDIWEANSMGAAYTPHVCNVHGQVRCDNPVDCGDGNDNRYKGICDKDGCDFSSFRLGDKEFLGPGKIVDTTKKITVVTQFITNNNQATGDLVEIRRVYVQNGKVIQNSKVNLPGMDAWDSITDEFCVKKKQVFKDQNSFTPLGGMKQMGEAFKRGGMVLTLSLWDDHAANMLWLDSNYPLDRDPSQPGVARGTCPTSSGKPEEVEAQHPDATVKYSNIKWGPIGSTFKGSSSGGGGSVTTTAPAAEQTRYGQCGGLNWSGPTQCVSGLTCVEIAPPYYSHCQ